MYLWLCPVVLGQIGNMGEGMETNEPESPQSQRDTLNYVEHFAKDLRTIAVQSNLGFLAYLFSMVEDDAAASAKRLSDK
jgi:hypothetical protein